MAVYNCTHVVEETKILVTTSSITKLYFYPTVPIAIALLKTLTIKYQMHLSETEIVMTKQIMRSATMMVAIVAHMIVA